MNPLDAIEILLVEDDAADAELTIRSLRRSGLANQLHHVKDGAAALDFLFGEGEYAGRRLQPRLVLLDLKLPKVDGLEVLRRVKGHPDTRTTPVVVMTSSREERDLVDSYRLGVNGYVVKPVVFEEFTEAVARIGLYWMLVNQTAPR